MRRIGRRLSPLLVSISVLTIGGCTTLEGLPQGHAITDMAPARLPQAMMVGDRSYFANGRLLEVSGVSGDLIHWTRSKQHSYRSDRNFILPPALAENAKKRTVNSVEGPLPTVWPLTLGLSFSFYLQRVSIDKATGERNESRRYWTCEVGTAQRITVLAGSFDTYRIHCTRKTASYKFRQHRIWYYAAEIEQPVLRLDYYRKDRKRSLELTALVPALPGLSESSARDYRDSFQQVMDTVVSGEQAVWTSRREKARIAIVPQNTVRWQDGTYCRNYRQHIRIAEYDRQAAGMVCRSADGGWKVPRKIDRERGVRF